MRNILYYLDRKWHKSSPTAQFPYRSLSKTCSPIECRHAGFAPRPNILCENLGFQASILQGQLRVLAFAVSFCFCRAVFAFAVQYLLLPWGICFCREFLLLPCSICFCREFLLLPWSICFCREFLLLPWGICFCREGFGFAVRYFVFAVRFLVLPWGFCFCREGFGFALTVVGHRKLCVCL